MAQYAKTTTVSSDKSQAEIRKVLTRYGATKFATLDEDKRAMVGFEIADRRIRFTLHLPSRTENRFIYDGRRRLRPVHKQREAYEQAIRQSWRALLLVITAKLEAAESKIETLEEAFMAEIVMPNGQTVGEWMKPQIAQAYLNGRMPPLMLTE